MKNANLFYQKTSDFLCSLEGIPHGNRNQVSFLEEGKWGSKVLCGSDPAADDLGKLIPSTREVSFIILPEARVQSLGK